MMFVSVFFFAITVVSGAQITEVDILKYLTSLGAHWSKYSEKGPAQLVQYQLRGWKFDSAPVQELTGIVCERPSSVDGSMDTPSGPIRSDMIMKGCELLRWITGYFLMSYWKLFEEGAYKAESLQKYHTTIGGQKVYHTFAREFAPAVCREPNEGTISTFQHYPYEAGDVVQTCQLLHTLALEYLVAFHDGDIAHYKDEFRSRKYPGKNVNASYDVVKTLLPDICDDSLLDCNFFINKAHEVLTSGKAEQFPNHDAKPFMVNECKKRAFYEENELHCDHFLKYNLDLLTRQRGGNLGRKRTSRD